MLHSTLPPGHPGRQWAGRQSCAEIWSCLAPCVVFFRPRWPTWLLANRRRRRVGMTPHSARAVPIPPISLNPQDNGQSARRKTCRPARFPPLLTVTSGRPWSEPAGLRLWRRVHQQGALRSPARSSGYNGEFMPQLLKEKTALVLGLANRWSLAYAIARAFRREGAQLILTYQGDRQQETVEELARELGASRVMSCDVTQEADIDHLSEMLRAEGDDLHAVVHSIAFANKDDLARPFYMTSRDGFLLAHEISCYSLVAVARAVTPIMRQGGSITTLTYLGSQRVLPNYNVMGVAKAALEASVRYLASELGPQQIRVNAISAGPVKTASARGIKDFSKILETVSEKAPLRRPTEPDEVADAAVFLASHLGRGVTGNILYVDSGYQIMGI